MTLKLKRIQFKNDYKIINKSIKNYMQLIEDQCQDIENSFASNYSRNNTIS